MKDLDAQVDRLAHLARLEFSAEEKAQMVGDMEKILRFVDKIEELDLAAYEPLVYVTDEHTVLRPDVVQHDITKDEALRNAPDRDSDYFRVPKVMRRDED